MSSSERIRLIGGTGSPYTQKMVALLRYRHIPYAITWNDPNRALDALGIERPRPILMPTFLFEGCDGGVNAVCDSTPIIRRLEAMYSGRSVLPADPALAFLDYLIEDFADEWCTKYMFHYRWHPQEDAENAGTLLPLGFDVSMPRAELQTLSRQIAKRQVERLYVVGSNEVTAPVIDASYQRFLAAMENHLEQQPFLLGRRPGASDFSLYGQLTQLVGFDPTPRALTHKGSPRAVAWVNRMEDQSGLEPAEGDWNDCADLPSSLRVILEEVGRVYVPALLANARAVEGGRESWQAEIDGSLWSQRTFPYQAKCLKWINEEYRALGADVRAQVDAALEGTGCEEVVLSV
jgi:glutathione S-transferase